jgi:hypothetical protein
MAIRLFTFCTLKVKEYLPKINEFSMILNFKPHISMKTGHFIENSANKLPVNFD